MVNNKRVIACFFAIIILCSIILSARPARAGSDYGAADWATHYLKVAAEVAAAVAIQRLTGTIMGKLAKGGPDGGAAFIQNWINFATKAQYQGENIFRAELSSSHLCGYLSQGIKSIFGVSPTSNINIAGQNVRTDSLQTFGLQTNCTLPSNFNITNYQKDFAGNGGWDAWSRMMEPQNNPYGVLLTSLDEVAKQRNLSQSTAKDKAVAGQGFLGFNEKGKDGKDCQLRVGNNCVIQGNVTNPGTIVGNTVANVMDNPSKFLAGGNKEDIIVTTAVSALTSWITNKLFDNLLTSDTATSNGDIPSPQRTADSYKQEFCMAEDNISPLAGSWIKDNYPQAWQNFSPEQPACAGHIRTNPWGLPGTYSDNGCGKSYCEQVREKFDKNSYPYSRCTESCMQAVSGAVDPSHLPPGEYNPTDRFPTPPPSTPPSGGFVACDTPPNATSPDPMAIMQQVKAEFPNINLANDNGTGPGTRDEFTAIVAWRLNQIDPKWGRKRAAGPQSTDTLGYLRPDIGQGRFEAVDIIVSSGALQRGCYGVVDSGQTWIQPSPAPTGGTNPPAPPPGTPYVLGPGWDNPMTTATNLVKQALLHGLTGQPAIDYINTQGTGVKAMFTTNQQDWPCTECILWYDKQNYAGNFQWVGPDGPYNGWNASWDSSSYVPWDGRPNIFVGPDGKMPTKWRFQPNQ